MLSERVVTIACCTGSTQRTLLIAQVDCRAFTPQSHPPFHTPQDDGSGGLDIGAKVTSAICKIVRDLATFPGFLVAKGGITSNDVAVEALQVRRADVLGCVRPGVPVWRCGPDSRAEGLAYVVFPGNVGGECCSGESEPDQRWGGAWGSAMPMLRDIERLLRHCGGAVQPYWCVPCGHVHQSTRPLSWS